MTEPDAAIATVLVMDDRWRASNFEQYFRDHTSDLVDEGLPADRFELFGPVVQTTSLFRATMLRAFKDGVLPDVVLLDHLVPPSSKADAEQSSVRVMRWLRDECAAREIDVPKCVLWTARYSPGLAYAFVRAGGRHALGHEAGPDQLVDLLWRVLRDNAVWSHAPDPPKLQLGDKTAALLPYLEADLPVHEITAGLTRDERKDVTADHVHDRRRALVSAINEQLGMKIVGSGLSTSLAKIALEHGHIWEPLEFRER